METLWYLCTVLINVYVASPDPDPDPNPRGGGQLPNPNECNSSLTSVTNNIYPYPYIDVNDRGHHLRITHMQRRHRNFRYILCIHVFVLYSHYGYSISSKKLNGHQAFESMSL